MMKVVLIGAGGFLGKAIWRSLYKKDHQHDWHLFSSSIHASECSADNCHTYIYKWPQNTLAETGYENIFVESDVIIYAAGAGIQPGERTDEKYILNLNLFEPARLSQILVKKNFKGQLITFGSYFESGQNQQRQLLDEKSFLEQSNPLPNTYCRSKKDLTHLHFIEENTGIRFKWLHLVLTNIYGPYENPNRLIPYIISRSKQGLPLHFTSGSQIRQYTYIDDVVHVIGGLLGKASGLYHVTNEETVSVRTVIDETVRQVKRKWSVEPELYYDLAERRDTAMDYLALSARKLYNEWGLSCPTSLSKGVSFYFDE